MTTLESSGAANETRTASSWRPSARILAPIATLCVFFLIWEIGVRVNETPHYILPAPSLIFATLIEDGPSLLPSLWVTVKLTFYSLGLAVLGGAIIGSIFAMSRTVEMCFFPFAVILQVTPIVAIAPLILIYVDSTFAGLLICGWIVAFFPMLSGTVIGLRSADHNLKDYFALNQASTWQRLRFLLAPSALPYFMSSLKVAGGLSLIGAVVAEFVAGTAGSQTGLASRILESMFRSETPRMFAALFMVSMVGIAIFFLMTWLSKAVLGHWHESELKRER